MARGGGRAERAVAVGLIGCGAIGKVIASALSGMEGVRAVLLYDIRRDAARSLSEKVRRTRVAPSFGALLAASDFMVEAASQEAVRAYLPRILRKGRPAMVMSVGAFGDAAFRAGAERLAVRSGVRIYIPSGAVGALDALGAAALGGGAKVELTTLKPAAALAGAPGYRSGKAGIVYSGDAAGAVRLFPQNVNVAGAVSLAGVGFARTAVRVRALPSGKRNIHRLKVTGDFGRFTAEFRNRPSPDNPKTSHLAALAAVAALRKILAPGGFWVGV